MATVHLPTPLRKFTAGQSEVEVAGDTVIDVLNALEEKHQGIRAYLFDTNQELKRHVRLFLNDEDVAHIDGWRNQALGDKDTIFFVVAMAGG
ncbi:MoaD/ThiS family protein [Haliangium sp.]|uniref:MoaD/ThiS family protein n=1 Tax=Haliangium sp. TaxID=2663208 RepID=UPI003D0DF123